MKIKMMLVGVFLFSGFEILAASQTRTWTDTQGRTLVAEFMSEGDGKVTVKRSRDAEIFVLDRATLSDADQDYVLSLRDAIALRRIEEPMGRNLAFPEQALHVERLKNAARTYLAARKRGDKSDAPWNAYRDESMAALKAMPVLAGDYNEITRTELPKPVHVGWTPQAKLFVSIGEGVFGRATHLETWEWNELAAALGRAIEWSLQAREEGIEAKREVGKWRDLTVEFESYEKGTVAFYTLKIARSGHLHGESVRLTRLNTQALLQHMLDVPQRIETDIAKQDAGARLK